MTSLLQQVRKFRHDFDFVRRKSKKFDIQLHCELWLKDKLLMQNPCKAGFPWINYAVIQFLHHFLKKDMKVLEFGSGGSSIFFLKRKVHLISIEHEEVWLTEVQKRIPKNRRKVWESHLISSKNGTNGIPSSIDYLSPIRKIADTSIDLLLVDGRHRVDCIRRSISKIKPNGYIILDNSDRPEYSETFELLREWQTEETACITNASDWVTPATIWKRPPVD